MKAWLLLAAFALTLYALRQLLTRRSRKILHENIQLIAKILLWLALIALVWLGSRRIFA